MAKRKEDPPPPGSPAWMATFGDMMNLLLCFFVLLFSMSEVDAKKFEAIAASLDSTFSIFSSGATTIGEGILISQGASQLNDLAEYMNSTGLSDQGETIPQDLKSAEAEMEQAQLEESEKMASKIEEALQEQSLGDEVEIEFTAQYVQLTLSGALLFDSGSVELKAEAPALLDQVGIIVERYAEGTIQIEGHTDNVPMHGAKYSNNDELSGGRAYSVFDYLISNTALDPRRVIHAGRGEFIPIASNETEEGRAKNRRVEIKIYNSLSSY